MTAIIDAPIASETEGWLTRSALRQGRCALGQEFPARTGASCRRLEAEEQRAYGSMAEQLREPPEILVLALPLSVNDVRAVRRPIRSGRAPCARPGPRRSAMRASSIPARYPWSSGSAIRRAGARTKP